MNRPTCIIDGCAEPRYARGLCFSCYQSARRQVKLGRMTWEAFELLDQARPKQPWKPRPSATRREKEPRGRPTKISRVLSEKLQVVRTMPPLAHWDQQSEYDVMNCQVMAWVVAQPSIRQWLFDRLCLWRLIVFDKQSQTWRGNPMEGPSA